MTRFDFVFEFEVKNAGLSQAFLRITLRELLYTILLKLQEDSLNGREFFYDSHFIAIYMIASAVIARLANNRLAASFFDNFSGHVKKSLCEKRGPEKFRKSERKWRHFRPGIYVGF
jgi:hypothetical protein